MLTSCFICKSIAQILSFTQHHILWDKVNKGTCVTSSCTYVLKMISISVSILRSVRNHHSLYSGPVTMGAPGVTPGQVTTSCAQPRLPLVHRASPGLWLADQGQAPTSVWCHNTAIRAGAVTNPTQPAEERGSHLCADTLQSNRYNTSQFY